MAKSRPRSRFHLVQVLVLRHVIWVSIKHGLKYKTGSYDGKIQVPLKSVTCSCSGTWAGSRMRRRPISQSCFETISPPHYLVPSCFETITLSHPVPSFFDVICRVPVWQTGGGRVVKSWSVLKPHGATRRDWHACRVGRWQLGNTTRKVAWQLCSSTRWGTSVMSKLLVFQWPKLDGVDPSHWKSGQFLMSPHLNFLF